MFYNNSMNKNKYPELMLTFMKIGIMTFGGGYAMIALIEKEIVENKKWISEEDILEIVAIAESTPGSIAVNAATFVGYKVSGVLGSISATFGVVFPSFAIIIIIAELLKLFGQLSVVNYAFIGIRAAVLTLLISTAIKLYNKYPKSIFNSLIIAFAFLSVAFFKLNVFIVIIICAIAGLIFNKEEE